MKNLLFILILLLSFVNTNAQNQPAGCCPKFELVSNAIRPCDDYACKQIHANPDGGAGSPGRILIACKNQQQSYLVVPNLTGFTYSWTVVGGSIAVTPANPGIITWGNNSQGFIQVIVSSADGKCRDTIRMTVCLVDGPTAGITFNPNPVCALTPVNFSGSTSIGASGYYWDFGDGTFDNVQNPPPHLYATGGVKIIILTVFNLILNSKGELVECGCKDTAMVKIIVGTKKGIDIHTDDCRKMLCPGDTIKYCTSTVGCTGLNWVVNGGTIVSGQGTTCIKVVWNMPSTYPTTVTLNATCPNTCGNSSTINVPVLYPNLPIQGPTPVCPSSTTSYSLPALPGTFYKWTLSGGGTIAGVDSNHNIINVTWNSSPGGPYYLVCNYKNPYSGCSGSSTIKIYIKPKFQISGLSPVCTNSTSSYFVNGGGNANWNITPTSGYTPPGIPAGTFSSVSSISLTWNVAGSYNIYAVPINAANYCTPSDLLNVIVNPTPILNPIVGNIIICPNQLYAYSVSSNVAGGNFAWSFTAGTGNIAPYGANNSLASVLFTGAGPWTLQASQTVAGCTGTKTLSITKVPAPPAITLSPGASTCSGGTITATVAGAIPPGGYVWSATPGAVLTGGQGTNSATFTINSNATLTITSCGGSSSINVTATAATVTITKVNGACSATLTAAPSGGTYNWFLNGSPVGSGSPFTVTQNGTYVLQATYPGPCIATNQIIVTGITPVIATISAIGNICNGGSVTMQAPIPANCPGATFLWSNGATGPTMTTNLPGSYFVTVSCSNGCTDVSNVIVVSPCVPAPGCIPDLVISTSNCPNPVSLTTNIPAGCTPVSTAWYYGDGFSGPTGNHLYADAGAYQVYAVMTCSNGTKHCDTVIVTVPMVDSFTSVISCGVNAWSIQLQDASRFLAAYAGYSITWSTTCGSLSATNIPNPILTVPFGCNPTITLTISKNGCTLTKSFTFNFPTTTFSILGGPNVCKDAQTVFNSSYTAGVISYAWNFGDATTGVTNPITHAYNGTPINPTISLTIKDRYGCIFTTSKPITVLIPTALTITPSPIVKICPDCLPPLTLNTNPAASFTGFQWYQNGAAISGATNSTYQLCNFNASGNYTVSAISNNNGCPVKSDTVMVIYLPKPLADIQGQTVQCASGSSPWTISVQNAGGNNPNYTYNWTCTGPGSVTFSPDNLQFYASAAVTQLGTYQFILTVTDITTGCVAKDTFCVYLYLSPSVTIAPIGYLCEGINHTYTATATPTNPNYIYQWSNGASGQTMTTAQAGNYYVTVVDPISGCFGTSNMVTIKKRPYLALFPIGCDTLCDTAKIIPPLPLGPGQTYNGVYNIRWFVDGNYHSTGPFLSLTGLSLGQHQITIQVTYLTDSCAAKSGKYDLFIKNCNCSCKGSSWGEITMNKTDNPDMKANIGVGNSKKLECKKTYDVACNQTYLINGKYKCADSTCNGVVKYKLQPPSGGITTGNLQLNFIPSLPGIYTLTLYGWCGDKICDSCVIKFKTNCDSSSCCPYEIKVNPKNPTYTAGINSTLVSNNFSISIPATVNITEVRANVVSYTIDDNYKKECMQCVNLPFTWASVASALNINAAPPKITMYGGATVPSFNGSGTGVYQNPREVIWNNGSNLNAPNITNIGMTFILPPKPAIDCCELKGKICVKFTFRDANCKECEIIGCFDFKIK